MQSHITKRFRKLFGQLPPDIKMDAKAAYRLWKTDPLHPGLHFKRVSDEDIWSVRIGLHYRALGLKEGDEISWIWIGHHHDYDKRL